MDTHCRKKLIETARLSEAISKVALRVFVSSVQKELEDERLIIQNLISTDVFLAAHCAPVLYECEPASPERAIAGCLKTLDTCQVYVLVVGSQSGAMAGKLTLTHTEYRRAKELRLPILAFIKGDRAARREAGTQALLAELDTDGFKYKRFGNIIELQKEVRAALVTLLRERFGLVPTADENVIAAQTIEATSPFESQPSTRMSWSDLDQTVARRLVAAASGREPADLSNQEVLCGVLLRGLVWHDQTNDNYYATAAGVVVLAPDPAAVFPQCRILADAYRGSELDCDPRDHEDIRDSMPLAIERAIAFIDRNTRHPMRVVRLNRVRLDEYPVPALREALLNAVAHRQYEDAGRKIMLEVFFDRIIISSPGLPPAPITIANLRKGKYRPCSRNPVIAQALSYFHHIEERGSGFRRMNEQMLNHGLDMPAIGADTGYFQVIFPGPGDDMKRLRVSEGEFGGIIPVAAQDKLNRRQKKIIARILKEGSITTGWCRKNLLVAYDTIRHDLLELQELGIIQAQGKGRNTHYIVRKRI